MKTAVTLAILNFCVVPVAYGQCSLSCGDYVERNYRPACDNPTSEYCKMYKRLACSTDPNMFPDQGLNNRDKIEFIAQLCLKAANLQRERAYVASQRAEIAKNIMILSEMLSQWKQTFETCSASERHLSICYENYSNFNDMISNMNRLISNAMSNTTDLETRGSLIKLVIALNDLRAKSARYTGSKKW